jgi:hypothetical protein
MRIHREEIRGVEAAELAAGIDLLVRESSSPISQRTFSTLNELRRPQTFSTSSFSRYRPSQPLLHYLQGLSATGPTPDKFSPYLHTLAKDVLK